jgi:hypothetical protein
MTTLNNSIPQEWRDLFEGRRIAVASLPPAIVPPIRRNRQLIIRGVLLVLMFAAAVTVSVWLATATGRWWIGLLVFTLIAWVLAFFVIGLFGAVKVARVGSEQRRAKAMEDPIGRLLPSSSFLRSEFDNPDTFAALLALKDRPSVVFDRWLIEVIDLPIMIGTLAPRGRLPEPEVLESSRFVAGSSFAGAYFVFHSGRFWFPLLEAFRTGAPLAWTSLLGLVFFVFGIWMIVKDPWLRRKLHLPNFFAAETVIGAGWLRDRKGHLWTVDDSILLITSSNAGIEVRCINKERVGSFYLSMLTGRAGEAKSNARKRVKLRAKAAELVSKAAVGAKEAVGFESDPVTESEMPTSAQPLRLLLSSWTYPEPRTDLAIRQ